MKKAVLAAIVVAMVGLGNIASAQDQERGPHPKERFERMAKQLELSEEQRTVIKQILKESREEMNQIKGTSDELSDDQRTRLKELRKATDDQIKAVLSKEQAAKFDELKSRRRDHRKEKFNQ